MKQIREEAWEKLPWYIRIGGKPSRRLQFLHGWLSMAMGANLGWSIVQCHWWLAAFNCACCIGIGYFNTKSNIHYGRAEGFEEAADAHQEFMEFSHETHQMQNMLIDFLREPTEGKFMAFHDAQETYFNKHKPASEAPQEQS